MVILAPQVSSFDLRFVSQMGIWFIWLPIGLIVWKYPCSISYVSPNAKFIECHMSLLEWMENFQFGDWLIQSTVN
jgi:hypothetical protein